MQETLNLTLSLMSDCELCVSGTLTSEQTKTTFEEQKWRPKWSWCTSACRAWGRSFASLSTPARWPNTKYVTSSLRSSFFRVIYCSLRGQFSFTNQLTNQGPFKLRERLLLVAVAVFTGLYFFILLLFLWSVLYISEKWICSKIDITVNNAPN